MPHLNTSYVTLQRFESYLMEFKGINLNTSYVTLQQ